MTNVAPRRSGRHFLQIPGPTPVPDRLLRAMAMPTIDHRGPEFGTLGMRVLAGIKTIFQTRHPVVIYPASGTGAWEAALVNTLSPGDRILMFESGHFATLWKTLAGKLGIQVDFIESDWRHPADPAVIAARLRADAAHAIKAVCVVHNETSTGCVTDVKAVRAAIDAAGHPALLLVDCVSSLGSIDYRHDAWGVDVTVSGSQKGLMLPPGLSFTAVSEKAIAAQKLSSSVGSYWRWDEMLASNATGYFPYTPATNLLYALDEAIVMLHEEGLDAVFARHERHGAAVRAAVRAWGLDLVCADDTAHSGVLTGVYLPVGHDADAFRGIALDRFDMSLGMGLAKLKGRVFRIGHLGDTNDLTILAALAGVEMTLSIAQVPHRKGGVEAAMAQLSGEAAQPLRHAAE